MKALHLGSFCCVLLFWSYSLFSQQCIEANIGVGVPDFVALGGRFQQSQMQVEFKYGIWPGADMPIQTFSGNVYLHFLGSSAYSSRKPWFGMMGYTYYDQSKNDAYIRHNFLNFRLGREINFSERVGLTIGAGVLYELTEDTKGASEWGESKIWPSLDISIFYKLKKWE